MARARLRAAAVAFSLAVHAGLVLGLALRPAPPDMPENRAIAVRLVEAPRVPQPPDPQPRLASAGPVPPARPPRPRVPARRAPPSREVASLEADAARSAGDSLTGAEIAGAATAGPGAGRGCDMVGHLQAALRRDARVQAAMARAAAAAGRPVLVWNGAWVRSPGQEGGGLAAVREALAWEVAFAPPACRTEPVSGLVLISMRDGADAPRLVLGSGVWRWSDLLHAGGGRSSPGQAD